MHSHKTTDNVTPQNTRTKEIVDSLDRPKASVKEEIIASLDGTTNLIRLLMSGKMK